MRLVKSATAILSVVVMSGSALAAPATQPAPPTPAEERAVSPPAAAAPVAPAPAESLIVYPLAPFNHNVRFRWIGRAVQEDLVSSISGAAGIQILALPPDATPPTDDQ